MSSNNFAKHIAISVRGAKEFSKNRGVALDEAYRLQFENVKHIISSANSINQDESTNNISILSFYILASDYEQEDLPNLISSTTTFFNSLLRSELLQEQDIKIRAIGKWYDLPGETIEIIKQLIETTQESKGLKVYFCINYDGQDEILDAFRVMAKLVQLGKLDPYSIRKENIKEHLYTADIPPPELIIKTGFSNKIYDLFLWDSVQAKLYFSKIDFPEFTAEEFQKALVWEREN